jgi:hypothetical protein
MFVSKLSASALMWDPKILMNQRVSIVRRCVSRNGRHLDCNIAASGHAYEQRASRWGMCSLSQDGWAADEAAQCLWQTDRQTARPLLQLRRGTSTPRLWAADLPNWLTCADQVSCVSRVTPRQCAVWIHCIGCSKLGWPGCLDTSQS